MKEVARAACAKPVSFTLGVRVGSRTVNQRGEVISASGGNFPVVQQGERMLGIDSSVTEVLIPTGLAWEARGIGFRFRNVDVVGTRPEKLLHLIGAQGRLEAEL